MNEKDKEKQIEEMAKELKELAKIIRVILENRTDIKYIPDLDFPIAKEVLKHYQPKLPKDSVVLSMEEYEKLTKELVTEQRAKEIAQEYFGIVRKETAETILKKASDYDDVFYVNLKEILLYLDLIKE